MKINNNFLKKINLSKISSIKNIFNDNKGDIINTFLFTAWGIHEQSLITNYIICDHNIAETVLHLLLITWQYTGLFIISHDLHHNKNKSRYQDFLGRLSLFCYGGFILEDFSKKHELHHKYPGIDGKDPDFYDGHPIIWYLTFLSRYISIKQGVLQILVYNLSKSLELHDTNLIIFWLIPSILASMQLFYFGTYLVHEKNGVIKDSDMPDWLITITSYNFGYHKQHHKFPMLPWFNLNNTNNNEDT